LKEGNLKYIPKNPFNTEIKTPTNISNNSKLVKPKLTLYETLFDKKIHLLTTNNSLKKKDEKKITYIQPVQHDSGYLQTEPTYEISNEVLTASSKNKGNYYKLNLLDKKKIEFNRPIKPTKISLHDLHLMNFDLKNDDHVINKEREM